MVPSPSLLILDLDDTIFNTQTIPQSTFKEALQIIHNHVSQSNHNPETSIRDLWSMSPFQFFKEYNTPKEIQEDFQYAIRSMNYSLDIDPFPDYNFLKSIPIRKILVTSGIKELQLAKIKALEIEEDFEAIHIDDVHTDPDSSKENIFTSIIEKDNLIPENIWVIGDNPESELKAGRSLNMTCFIRTNESNKTYTNAHHINTFEDLPLIP